MALDDSVIRLALALSRTMEPHRAITRTLHMLRGRYTEASAYTADVLALGRALESVKGIPHYQPPRQSPADQAARLATLPSYVPPTLDPATALAARQRAEIGRAIGERLTMMPVAQPPRPAGKARAGDARVTATRRLCRCGHAKGEHSAEPGTWPCRVACACRGYRVKG